MFLFPMTFMMIVTLASLVIIVRNQIGMIMKGGGDKAERLPDLEVEE